jgi:hypothetical protein
VPADYGKQLHSGHNNRPSRKFVLR